MLTANTDANTTRDEVRHITVLPCEWSATALGMGTSFVTSLQFYHTFLAPVIADLTYAPIVTWWKAATTEMAVGAIVNRPVALDLAGVLPPDPASREPLQRWVARRAVSDLMDLPGDNTGFNRVTNAIIFIFTLYKTSIF